MRVSISIFYDDVDPDSEYGILLQKLIDGKAYTGKLQIVDDESNVIGELEVTGPEAGSYANCDIMDYSDMKD